MKVAVIPARGGSKRIPGKNIREFAGKPIIAHSIERAIESGLFERVIVSTDDHAIAQVALEHGAEVPFIRPDNLSDEHSGLTEVMAHAVSQLGEGGTPLSAVCCILATAPFMRTNDLAQGLEQFESGRWNYVFSATTFPSPIFRSFRITESGEVEMFYPEHFASRSQDLPEAMHDAAQFCWGTPLAWIEKRVVFAAGSTVVVIPRWRVHDIDTFEDWRRAELMHSAMTADTADTADTAQS